MHNVHIEDDMGESASSVETVDLRNIQDAYVMEDVHYTDNKYPILLTEVEEEKLDSARGLLGVAYGKLDGTK
eukprot:4428123-Amphidinium_carterae.1